MAIGNETRRLVDVDSSRVVNGKKTFQSLTVIGAAGKTGELFTRCLAPIISIEAVVRERRWRDEDSPHPDIRFHRCIGAMMEGKPEAIIVATPNPTQEVLQEIAEHIQRPTILILPQNGVDVVPTAEKVLIAERERFSIVRASLFTNVNRDKEGNIVFNPDKNRIALAPVGDQAKPGLQKAEALFRLGGFDVEVVDNYQSMEWTKLLANLFGSSSTVTYLSPKEALSNKEIFELEYRALRDRLAILQAAKIDFADISWVKKLGWLAKVPLPVATIFRPLIASMFASERNNQPPAAAEQIDGGARKVETTKFYHKPIIELAKAHKLASPVDVAIYGLLHRHEISLSDGFSLTTLSADERRKLLLEIVNLESLPALFPENDIVQRGTEIWFNRTATEFKILGEDNLREAVAKGLRKSTKEKKGSSIILAFNHRGHPDHPAVVKAVREVLGQEYPLVIVAGMLFGKDLVSGLTSQAYPRLQVWTVDENTSREERWRANIINRKAAKKIDDLLDEGGYIILLYPEGSRSKTGQLQPAKKGITLWLDPRIGQVVSGVVTGSEIMLPPGQRWPRKAAMAVEFGVLVDGEELRRSEDASGRVMRAIAKMLPEDKRGIY